MKPILLRYIRFSQTNQQVPGGMSSSITSHLHPTQGRERRHHMEWHPWMCMYWIEYYDRAVGNQDANLEASGYIAPHGGDYVETLDGKPVPAPEMPTSATTRKK